MLPILISPIKRIITKHEGGENSKLGDHFRGEFTFDTFAKVLSDHQNSDCPVSPCLEIFHSYHGKRLQAIYSSEDLPWGTVSAEILQPSQNQFWYP